MLPPSLKEDASFACAGKASASIADLHQTFMASSNENGGVGRKEAELFRRFLGGPYDITRDPVELVGDLTLVERECERGRCLGEARGKHFCFLPAKRKARAKNERAE